MLDDGVRMRKFAIVLGMIGMIVFAFMAPAVAQDEAEKAEAGTEVQAQEAPAKANNSAQDALAQMDASQSYRHFVNLLRACGDVSDNNVKVEGTCDKDAIWNMIDKQSKLVFVYAYASLVRVDRIIETYFDPIEHKQMRERTGTNIIKDNNVTDAQSLFKYIFKPEKLVFNANTNSGLEIKSEEKDKTNPYAMIIHTFMENQDFLMVRESDNVWRNASLVNIFQTAVEPIFESEKNMKEFAKDNLMAEINRRKEVLDYFIHEQALREARRLNH